MALYLKTQIWILEEDLAENLAFISREIQIL